jgi:hypothetical protein
MSFLDKYSDQIYSPLEFLARIAKNVGMDPVS